MSTERVVVSSGAPYTRAYTVGRTEELMEPPGGTHTTIDLYSKLSADPTIFAKLASDALAAPCNSANFYLFNNEPYFVGKHCGVLNAPSPHPCARGAKACPRPRLYALRKARRREKKHKYKRALREEDREKRQGATPTRPRQATRGAERRGEETRRLICPPSYFARINSG